MEARLRAEGRIVGPAHLADYRFLDDRLDRLYDWGLRAFEERNDGAAATWNSLRTLNFWARLDLPDRPRDDGYSELVHTVTALSNERMVDTLRTAIDILEDDAPRAEEHAALVALATSHAREDAAIRADVDALWARRPLHLAPASPPGRPAGSSPSADAPPPDEARAGRVPHP
jgi:hypothetical protein